jgi:hypothetical protein
MFCRVTTFAFEMDAGSILYKRSGMEKWNFEKFPTPVAILGGTKC